MGGGLMQLVAYGAQDIYLTGNPQITFFKVVYRRHTNFSMEAIQQTLNGSVALGGSTVTATISRNGDLVGQLWLDVLMKDTSINGGTNQWVGWTNNTGHALLEQCEVEIGGQLIDRHYSQWLDIYNEFNDPLKDEWIGLNKHPLGVDGTPSEYLTSQMDTTNQVFNPSKKAAGAAANDTTMETQLYIPLKFWFCRNHGLALPLIALQYHEVKIKLKTRSINALLCSSGALTAVATVPPVVTLWADYIYLDTDERRRFAQVSHEYLIEQLQRQSGTMSGTSYSQKLNFNHPVKELIWVVQSTNVATATDAVTAGAFNNPLANKVGGSPCHNATAYTENGDYFNYNLSTATTHGRNIEWFYGLKNYEGFGTAKLQLNGHDRFAARKASYFKTCQNIQSGHYVSNR